MAIGIFILSFVEDTKNNEGQINLTYIILILMFGIPFIIIAVVCIVKGVRHTDYIYFEEDKAWKKIGKNIYEWYWDDIIDCKLDGRALELIVIKTNKHNRKLVFNIKFKPRAKAFLSVCKNEKAAFISKIFTKEKSD